MHCHRNSCVAIIIVISLGLFVLLTDRVNGKQPISPAHQLEQLMALESSIHAGNLEKVDAYVDAAADQGFGVALYMRALYLMLQNRSADPQAFEDLSGALNDKVEAAAYLSPFILSDSSQSPDDANRVTRQALALFRPGEEPDIAQAFAKAMLIDRSRSEVSAEISAAFYDSAFAGSALASAYLLNLSNIDAHSKQLLCKVLQINKLVSRIRKCDGVYLRPTEQYGKLLFTIGKQVDAVKARLGNKYVFYSSLLCDPMKGSFNRSLACTEMLSAVMPFCELEIPSSQDLGSSSTISVCTPREIKALSFGFAQNFQMYFAQTQYNEGAAAQ